MKCDFCDNEKKRVAYQNCICEGQECYRKAVANNKLPNVSNNARTTFGRTEPPKYTARQEKAWREIAEATGFKE